jgi:hypothetical protein
VPRAAPRRAACRAVPCRGEIVTPAALSLALRAMFDSGEATGLSATWEVRAACVLMHVVVTDGQLEAGVGPGVGVPDLIMTFAPESVPHLWLLLRDVAGAGRSRSAAAGQDADRTSTTNRSAPAGCPSPGLAP